MVALTLRRDLVRPLTHSEMDSNFENLNTRVEISLTQGNNLSDVGNIETSRQNIGVNSATTLAEGLARNSTNAETGGGTEATSYVNPASLLWSLMNDTALRTQLIAVIQSQPLGARGGGDDEIFYENDQTVKTSYSITSSKNALTAGPITIGEVLTIASVSSDGSALTVTTSSANGYSVGDSVIITGTTGYNGTFIIASVASTTVFTITSALNIATETAGSVEKEVTVTVPNGSEWSIV